MAIDLAVTLLRKGEPEQVLRLLGKETDPLARYQVALAYSKLGRLAEAQSALEAAVREKPGFAEAWYQLGVISLALRKREEAERALRTSVQLRPDEATLRLAWAEALQALGKVQEGPRAAPAARSISRRLSEQPSFRMARGSLLSRAWDEEYFSLDGEHLYVTVRSNTVLEFR